MSRNDVGTLLAVAHRAGNNLADLQAALAAGVDLVEADIRLFRGALEVRHHRTLGPHLLWDKWHLARRRDTELPELREVLGTLAGDPRVMLDLKGTDAALAPRVAALLREVAPGQPHTVCTKDWRMFAAFQGDPHVRQVFSASNRTQLNRLRALLRRQPAFGVSIRQRLLTPALVAELRGQVEHVLVWPVDTPEALDHARWLGVTGVISKDLSLLRQILAAR
jgi:glycerophosphoryl diester phosphodiesterase